VLLVRGSAAPAAVTGAGRFRVDLGGEVRYLPHTRDLRADLLGDPAAWQDRPEELLGGFFLPIPITPALIGRTCRLRIDLLLPGGQVHPVLDREIAFVRRCEEDGEARRRLAGSRARLAICLATYEPDLRLFERQIDSIIGQTFQDWVCIVQDDRSGPERYREIERTCARDPRFVVLRNATNLGFYHNFERCLRNVPGTAELVALSDQDDRWYPDKLEQGLRRLTGDVQLVYSDMRLVDVEGRVLAESFWGSRRNNYRHLDTLLLANTVTGAASIFRRSLLERALPFPPQFAGTSYHDHWLACVAMMAGPLDFVDRPLYDYVQHGRNVIGYAGFQPYSLGQALARHARELAQARARLGQMALEALRLYYVDYRRLSVLRQVLAMRFPAPAPAHRRVLALFQDRLRDALALAGPTHLRVTLRGDTTNMIEFHVAVGMAVQKLALPLLPPALRLRGAARRLARALRR
jgi:glycosyltransferase involved in cell wall biosynthesis